MRFDAQSFVWGLLAGIALAIVGLTVLAAIGLATYMAFGKRTVDIKAPPVDSIPVAGDAAVTDALRPILHEHNVPAMAAAIVTSDGLQHVGVVGFRKRGQEVAATLDDLWHLGSDTKAMTATLVARLVEHDQLQWHSTMAEAFPDLAAKFHPEMKTVTLEQLLSHRAGLPANLSLLRYQGQDVCALRHRAVKEYLGDAPSHTPGSDFEYSNLGYIIAAAAVEELLDQTWEEAIRKELFEPLGMASVGFGGTGTAGKIDQPWPHASNGRPTPRNGAAMDNPPVMGPAGRVHCTIQDWAKFIQDQLRGARGSTNALLQAGSYTKLHTLPNGADYALGWGVGERDWAGGGVLTHSGDNTMNHCVVWVAPKRDFAVLVCVNQSGEVSAEACDDAAGAMIKLWQSKRAGEAAE